MADENKLYIIASDICLPENKSNDIFILIQARLCSTRANRNGQGVTLAFIDEVVNNPLKYDCLPLYCDTDRLLKGDHQNLGHMMTESGEFGTIQVGSITSFRKQQDEFGVSLIAQIRVPKREWEVCDHVMQMYNDGMLNFSFEIIYSPEHVLEIDGVQYVDVYEGNVLTGMAIVSVPAYPQSTALMLTAELEGKASEAGESEKEMTQEQIQAMIAQAVAAKEEQMAKVIAEKDAVIAERDATIAQMNKAVIAQATTETAEAKEDKEAVEAAEAEVVAECGEKENETASASAQVEEKKEEEKQVVAENATAEVDTLKAELARVQAELDAMKAEKAAAQLEANRATAKAFAEKQGLDVEDEAVAKAISEVDYKMIAELTMKDAKPAEQQQERIVIASLAGNGFEIRGGKWDDLLATRKD